MSSTSAPNLNLNLWKQGLGHVPDSVWKQTDLETLVLADNGLTEVSEEIRRLKGLRMLDLGHNALTSVPEGLGELDSLTDFLYLHDNRLTSLPSSLARLKRLRYLNIGDNAFDALPVRWIQADPMCLENLFASVNIPSPGRYKYNWMQLKDPKLDALFAEGRAVTDQAKRDAVYADAQQIIMDSALWFPVHNQVQTVAYRLSDPKKSGKAAKGAAGSANGAEDEDVPIVRTRPDVTQKGVAMIGDLRTDALHQALADMPIEDDTLFGMLILAFGGGRRLGRRVRRGGRCRGPESG